MFVLGQRSLGYEGPPEDHLRDHTHVSLFILMALLPGAAPFFLLILANSLPTYRLHLHPSPPRVISLYIFLSSLLEGASTAASRESPSPLPLSSCKRTVIDPNPCHIQDPLSVCGSRVYASGMTFLCTVFDQCHHHHCARICSSADYWRLASCSCPTCCTTVLPATPTKESQSSDMEPSHSTLSSMDSLSQRSLSIVPRSPAQMSTTANIHAFEGAGSCISTAIS